jgi:hypothetical protein
MVSMPASKTAYAGTARQTSESTRANGELERQGGLAGEVYCRRVAYYGARAECINGCISALGVHDGKRIPIGRMAGDRR